MKIAITADLHLTDRDRNPERFETLENLLADLRAEDVNTLIIAGDLFDETRQNYAEFEQILRRDENQEISIIAIPGNHDPTIDDRKIVADNLEIITTPTLRELDGLPFLFLPYEAGTTMGEKIELYSDQLPANNWVLVSHGDLVEGLRIPNPAESGVYMPLGRRDVATYIPATVILGHIHAVTDSPPVHYVGSPCGIDITETGRRKYVIYDTDAKQVERRDIKTPILYFIASFVVVPVEDEADHLRKLINEEKDKWNLKTDEIAKARIRVSIVGYSSDRSALQDVLDEEFQSFTFYKGERPSVRDVANSGDTDRHTIAQGVQEMVKGLDWPDGMDQPNEQDILLAALHIIYGE